MYRAYCATCECFHELPTSKEALQAAHALIPAVRNALDASKGCMVGVLVCRDHGGRIVHLRAYSGTKELPGLAFGWAPPTRLVAETLTEEGDTFEKLNALSAEIKALGWQQVLSDLEAAQSEFAERQAELRAEKKERKRLRSIARETAPNDTELAYRLEQQSFDDSVAYRKALRSLREPVDLVKSRYQQVLERMTALKRQRRALSNRLQLSFNQQHKLINFAGKVASVDDAHLEPARLLPGTGECAAPKLLQDAARRGLQPISIAEVWVGVSQSDPERIEGQPYSACVERCHPILGFMMCGAERSPKIPEDLALPILEEGFDYVAIDKPGRLLSAPGRGIDKIDSVVTRVRRYYPRGADARAAHRLDFETSGLMIVAVDGRAQARFHRMFIANRVEKLYIAWLMRAVDVPTGRVELNLKSKSDHGRMQCVDHDGKPSITDYEVIGQHEGGDVVFFYPRTGRTHQLRVHAAATEGLDNPIRGDDLYGTAGDVLFLHAFKLRFHQEDESDQTLISAPLPATWPASIKTLVRKRLEAREISWPTEFP